MIDNEWYIFVANPDYDDCDTAVGEACGGATIAHLNLQGSAARILDGVPSSGVGHTVIKVESMKLIGHLLTEDGFTFMI